MTWCRLVESHLDQVRVPGITGDAQVIIAKFLSGRLSEDMSYPIATIVSTQHRIRRRKATYDTSTPARNDQPWLWGSAVRDRRWENVRAEEDKTR